MAYTSNEHIPLYFNCCTKGATLCLNRKPNLDDYIDLYHDDDSWLNEEQYTFYVSSI